MTVEKCGSFRKYVGSGNAKVMADLRVDAKGVNEESCAVFELIDSLQNKGYGYNFAIEWNDETLYFIRNEYDTKITRQSVDEKFVKPESS